MLLRKLDFADTSDVTFPQDVTVKRDKSGVQRREAGASLAAASCPEGRRNQGQLSVADDQERPEFIESVLDRRLRNFSDHPIGHRGL